MERLTLRTAKSWGGVPVRRWQGEWYQRSSSRWHETLDGRGQQVSFNHQQKELSSEANVEDILSCEKKQGSCRAWHVCEKFSWFQLSNIQAWALVLAHIFQRVLLMNHQIVPGSHRVVFLDLQMTFSFLSSQGLLSASVSCLPYSWKSEKNRRVDTKPQTGWAGVHTTIDTFIVTVLGRRRKTGEVQGQPQILTWRPS